MKEMELGVYDVIEIEENLMDCNHEVICMKHTKYWAEQREREFARTISNPCNNGGKEHHDCGYNKCECHCHFNQIFVGEYMTTSGRWINKTMLVEVRE